MGTIGLIVVMLFATAGALAGGGYSRSHHGWWALLCGFLTATVTYLLVAFTIAASTVH